ncbi:hypothetical protein [Staphylococcus sp. EZ-P03]|uniref:hypothetical protein n=1 Tax=Staphylococcus sp. EZ-P03 TaxID=2282739 RepID=UPI000DF734B8|nr:hypothetical protein [Staphylococcus sp. EZ-P03]
MSASHQINRQKPQISELAIRIERLEENQKYNNLQVVTERIDWLIERQNNDHDTFNKKFEKIDENFKEVRGEIKRLDEKIDNRFEKSDEKINSLRQDMVIGFEKSDEKINNLRQDMVIGFEKSDEKISGLRKEMRDDLKLTVGLITGFMTILTVIQRMIFG